MALFTNESIIAFLTETNQTCPQMTSALKAIGGGSMKNGIVTLYRSGWINGCADGMLISGLLTIGTAVGIKLYSEHKEKKVVEQAKGSENNKHETVDSILQN